MISHFFFSFFFFICTERWATSYLLIRSQLIGGTSFTKVFVSLELLTFRINSLRSSYLRYLVQFFPLFVIERRTTRTMQKYNGVCMCAWVHVCKVLQWVLTLCACYSLSFLLFLSFSERGALYFEIRTRNHFTNIHFAQKEHFSPTICTVYVPIAVIQLLCIVHLKPNPRRYSTAK